MRQVLHLTRTIIKVDQFTSWGDLWKPEFANKVQLLDDAREVFNIALLKLGKNPNTTDPAEIKEAFEELKKLRSNVLSFNSDNPANSFISGEVSVGQLWNGSVRIAKKEKAPMIWFSRKKALFYGWILSDSSQFEKQRKCA